MLPSSGASDESRKEPHHAKYHFLLNSSVQLPVDAVRAPGGAISTKSITTFNSTWKQSPDETLRKALCSALETRQLRVEPRF